VLPPHGVCVTEARACGGAFVYNHKHQAPNLAYSEASPSSVELVSLAVGREPWVTTISD